MTQNQNRISSASFGTTAAGHPVEAHTLTSPTGASATLLTYGATLQQLLIPDHTGKISEVTLGFDNLDQYETQSPFFGSTVGRVANRIANAQFSLNNQTHQLAANNGPNHLHGGANGYDKRLWHAEPLPNDTAPAVRFTLTDPHQTENYPGTVHATVTFTLLSNTLRIDYLATTDQPTPINLTNHAYFNLKDAGQSDILSHIVQINADRYTPVDSTLIPTGELAPVKNTPFDFTTPKPIGQDLAAVPGPPPGYDHNFVLNQTAAGQLTHAATVDEPAGGGRRRLEVFTTQPGIQFYTGNFLNGTRIGRNSTPYKQHHAFCLETQHFPDSVHHPHFPSIILHPNETYRQTTEFRFSITPHSSEK